MKILSIIIVAMFVGGCSGMGPHGTSGMGTHGTSGGSGMSGTGATDGSYYRDSTAPFDPTDLHHGG